MIKKLFTAGFLLFLIPVVLNGQSLSVTEGNEATNSTSQFEMQQGVVTLGNEITFASSDVTLSDFEAYGLSPDMSIMGLLSIRDDERRATVVDARADTLADYEVTNFDSGERSLQLYPFNSGGSMIRNNIANFNIYDSFGELIENVSSASSAAEGQVISEVAMNPSGSSVAIYTPNIEYSSSNGSRIQFLQPNMRLEQIFSNEERTMETVTFSENGQFMAVLTKAEGSDDKIYIIDRHGNELGLIESSEDNMGATLSENGSHVVAYTDQRAVIYETISGERQGGTSFNAQLLQTQFFPEDNLLIALTGSHDEESGTASDLQFHGINFESQQVARKDYGSSLGFNEHIARYFERQESGAYLFKGAHKTLDITTSF